MFMMGDYIIKIESDGKKRFLYRTTCNRCSKDRGYKRLTVKGVCRECFVDLYIKGRKHSDATKQKIKENNYLRKAKHPWLGRKHSDATKSKLSNAQKEYCEKYGNQFVLGKSKGKHTKLTTEQISRSNLGNEPKWKGRIFKYDGPKGSFKLRSSYELFYAHWLDEHGIDWKYEPKYRLSNGYWYSPDFQVLLHGTIKIVEIKGFWTEKARNKWDTFNKDYPDIDKEVLYKNDLLSLGMKE